MRLPTESIMRGKLRGISALNSNPLDNGFCAVMAQNQENICSECYSRSALQRYTQNAQPKFSAIGKWFARPRTDKELNLINFSSNYVRFHAHGEPLNIDHAANFLKLAELWPNRLFALWTKRPRLVQLALVNRQKPSNLTLIYSSPKIGVIAQRPLGFDKVFTVFDYPPYNHRLNCFGKACINCLICYIPNKIRTVNELLK